MILVTGGAGFIGTHLCRKLIKQGHAVRVLDLRDPPNRVEGVDYVRGDIRDSALLGRVLAKVETVYHFAATVSVPLCQKDPIDSYSVNFTGTVQVLDAIRKVMQSEGRKIRFVFASTAALYGNQGDDGRALKESDVASEFSSFYAAQKFASEHAIQLYRQSFGVPAVIFRFFNVFGPGQDPTSPYSGVITVFCRLAKEGKDLPLNGGGTQTRDFVSVYDIAEACASALKLPDEKWDARPANLGTGSIITVKNLAEIILKQLGAQSNAISAPARDGDVLHSRADISRAKQVFGYKPQFDLEKGLSELI